VYACDVLQAKRLFNYESVIIKTPGCLLNKDKKNKARVIGIRRLLFQVTVLYHLLRLYNVDKEGILKAGFGRMRMEVVVVYRNANL
jgi:hypothetical protein